MKVTPSRFFKEKYRWNLTYERW